MNRNDNQRRKAAPNPRKSSPSLMSQILKFARNNSLLLMLLAAALVIGLLVGVILSGVFGKEKHNDSDGETLSESVSADDLSESLPLDIKFPIQDDNEKPSGALTSEATSESESESTSDSEVQTPVRMLDNMKIENTEWAYYLVNRSNTISADFEADTEFGAVYSNGRDYYFDARITEYVKAMINDAALDGVNLYVCSAYRSYKRQTSNFENRLREYANSKTAFATAYRYTAGYIAVPGSSEHQTGLAVDFITDGYMTLDDGFENTDAYKWLSKNAYKYGFILRYPSDKSDKTGIFYEPWHFRFIGFEKSRDITESGLCLEEYMEKNGDEFTPLESMYIPSTPAWYEAYLTAKPQDTSVDNGTSESTSATESASVSESTSETESASDSENTSETESASDSESMSETELASDSENMSETESVSDSENVSEIESVSDSENTSETELASDSENMSETESVSDSESMSEIESASDSENTSETEPSDESIDEYTETEGEHASDRESGDPESEMNDGVQA